MKIFILSLVFITAHFTFGQLSILNNALVNPDFPVAYRGFANKIVVKGYEKDSTVTIVTKNDTLKKIADYFYYLGSPLKKDTLIVYKEGKELAQKVYNIENLHKPKIFLGEIRDSLVTVEEILNNKNLIVTHEPQIAIPCTRVLEFNAAIIKKNGKEIPLVKKKQERHIFWSDKNMKRKTPKTDKSRVAIYSDINQFNSYQIKLIKNMKIGEVLHIKHCVLSCPSCRKTRVSINLKLTIK